MSLTEAAEEAYAANQSGEGFIEVIKLDHVSFDEPVYAGNGIEEDTELPMELGGTPVLVRALPISVVLPGMTEDGPTPLKLRVEDPNGVLTPYLEAAVQSTGAIEITYYVFTTADLTQPGDVVSGLFLTAVDQDASGAEGTVNYREIELQLFPLDTYDAENFPALQNN